MRVIVDGDAAMYKNDIYQLTLDYQIEMFVYLDYAHLLKDAPYPVIECEIGKDSVDMRILSDLKKGDLLITQDYGLAALALGKGAYVLHVSGLKSHHRILMSFY